MAVESLMEIESIKPVLAVAVSLVGAALIVVTRRSPNIREGCSLVAGIVKFLLVVTMIPTVLAGNTLHYTLFSFTDGVSIAFRVDAMGLLFATTASFLWILTTFYSIGYMRSLKEHAQTRYYLCFALTLSATIGVAFSANLLTLWLAYEAISFFTYPLVIHKETDKAFAAGNKYVFYLLMSSKLFLLAIILTYAFSGTLDFRPNGLFPADVNPILLTLTYFLFLVGISKAAMMPFHAWLPAAMIAPTPVSALLHAVAVVNAGVFCILRVVLHIFGLDRLQELNLGTPLVFIVSFTIVAASVMALTKDDLKARLAYSTISQLSYMIIGVALLTPGGITGGVLHIVNHAFAKITLFLCVGAIAVSLHKTKVSELNGIAKQMPFTMAAFTLGAFSLIAFPPFGGFISKWYLMIGSSEADQLFAIFVLVTSTVLNACYFLPIVYVAYFREPTSELPDLEHSASRIPHSAMTIREAPAIMVVPLMLAAMGTLIFFFVPSDFFGLAKIVAASAMGGN